MSEVHPIGRPAFQPCPSPRKAAYDRMSSALKACDGVRHRFELKPYLCCCGRYHLTAQGGRNDHSKTGKKGRRRKQ
jgi:hypothetical protein